MTTRQIFKSNPKEAIYNFEHKISQFIEKQRTHLSEQNVELFLKYNEDMVVHSISDSTRYKNLNHFRLLTNILQKDWTDVTESDLRAVVAQIMTKYGKNGKESGYSRVLKISLKAIVRFAKLNTRNKPEDGEYFMIKFIKIKKVEDKLTREDLPTDKELQKILAVCADSSRDKAMISVHAEAGTRINEVLGMKIKDFTIDKFGGVIKVDGKTGVRPIRIVKSVPYLTKWLNDHPYKDEHDSPLWIYIRNSDSFGKPMNYYGFNAILQKRVRQAGITKRISSHLFRHKEITDLANRLTESESRMRHGWEKSSLMPTRYSHLNQDDLDEKMLGIMGVKKPVEKVNSLKECSFCNVSYPLETRFCDSCSRPLDSIDAIQMEQEQEERTKSLILETLRQEHSNKSKRLVNKKLEEENLAKEKEIEQLKKLLSKVTE